MMRNIYYLAFSLILNILLQNSVQAKPIDYSPTENNSDTFNLQNIDPQGVENQGINNQLTFPQINQANDLITQPATIDHNWIQLPRRNNLNPQSNTIPLIRQQGCQNVLDLLKDPGTVIKECENKADVAPPSPTEQIEYFKIPRLDSGVKLRITDF